MQCPSCRKSVSFNATACPYCTRDIPQSAKGNQVAIGILAIIVVALFNFARGCGGSSTETSTAVERPATTESTADIERVPMPSYSTATGSFRCSADKVAAAKETLRMVTTPNGGLSEPMVDSVRETKAGGVGYTFNAGFWEVVEENLSALVTSISNADACVQGKARRIDFYRAGGRRVAFADPKQGIKISN